MRPDPDFTLVGHVQALHPPLKEKNWPGLEAGATVEQDSRELRELFHGPETLHRHLRLDLLPPLRIVGAGGLQEPGEVHVVRTDCVHGHTGRGVLETDGTHERVRTGAGRRVQRHARFGSCAGRTRVDDDLTATCFDHRWQRGLQGVKHHVEVRAFHEVPVVGACFDEAARDDETGQEARGVEPAPSIEGGPHQRTVALSGRQVGVGDDLDLGAAGGQLVDERLTRMVQYEAMSRRDEQPGQRRADVVGGVGQQRDGLVASRCSSPSRNPAPDRLAGKY